MLKTLLRSFKADHISVQISTDNLAEIVDLFLIVKLSKLKVIEDRIGDNKYLHIIKVFISRIVQINKIGNVLYV
jgi:hypothetical protein